MCITRTTRAMSDLPGPEKPAPWHKTEQEDRPFRADELMHEFQAILGAKTTAPVVANPRSRYSGAGGSGDYNGRSGRFLGKRVRDRHKMVVMLQVCGWTNNEIARATRYTPSRVSIILNSRHPELLAVRAATVERVANQTVDLSAKIRLAAPDALDKMISLVDSEDETVARLAARDILDRAGYSPVKKSVNVDTKVPLDELNGVLGKIHEANEVVMQRDNWVVKTLPRQSGAA